MWGLRGIDVAYPYQGDRYNVVGKSFVFVKATQGTDYVNPHMNLQIQWGENHGLVVGLYHFMEAGVSIEKQAGWFHAKAPVKAGYPIAVDWEEYHAVWPTNAEKDALIRRLQEIYPHNRVILYTNLDGWLNRDHTSFAGDGLWIAHPGTAGNTGVRYSALFHQYGIVSNVDQDAGRFDSKQALIEWASSKGKIMSTFDPSKEAGYGVWGYHNPEKSPDAWYKLSDMFVRLERVEQKVDLLLKHFEIEG